MGREAPIILHPQELDDLGSPRRAHDRAEKVEETLRSPAMPLRYLWTTPTVSHSPRAANDCHVGEPASDESVMPVSRESSWA